MSSCCQSPLDASYQAALFLFLCFLFIMFRVDHDDDDGDHDGDDFADADADHGDHADVGDDEEDGGA